MTDRITLSDILVPEAPAGLRTRTSKRNGLPLPRGAITVAEWTVAAAELPDWLRRVTAAQGGEGVDDITLTVLSSPDGACWVHASHSFWDGNDAVEAEALWRHAV